MANAQRLDPAMALEIYFQASNDGFATITPWGGATTRGSALADLAAPPMVRVDLPPVGWSIRARVFNPSASTFRTGFVVETTTGIRKGWQN